MGVDMNAEVEQAMKEGWLTQRGWGNSRYPVRHGWWTFCCRHELPFLVLTIAKTYAQVELDIEPTRRKLNRAGREQLGDLIRPYFSRSSASWGWRSCRVAGLRPPRAQELARALLDWVVPALEDPRLSESDEDGRGVRVPLRRAAP